MPRWRLARGLFGTALTWGAVGAFIGAAMFVARYRPWPVSAMHGERFFRLLGAFLGGGALWGAVCGVAFGVAVWRLGRRGSLEQVSTRRVMLWGALAGAAFPLLIYTPVVLRGAFGAIPFFATIAGVSAVCWRSCRTRSVRTRSTRARRGAGTSGARGGVDVTRRSDVVRHA